MTMPCRLYLTAGYAAASPHILIPVLTHKFPILGIRLCDGIPSSSDEHGRHPASSSDTSLHCLASLHIAMKQSEKQRYIDNTIGISAGNRTRIKNLLVRNIVWCFSYALWCISWYVPVLAF